MTDEEARKVFQTLTHEQIESVLLCMDEEKIAGALALKCAAIILSLRKPDGSVSNFLSGALVDIVGLCGLLETSVQNRMDEASKQREAPVVSQPGQRILGT